MPITQKNVEHIARLARIELTEAEAQKYEKDLSEVLDFVEKLNKVDTKNIEPLAGGTELKNVMREDVQEARYDPAESAKLVKAAPEHENGFVKVKKVFE